MEVKIARLESGSLQMENTENPSIEERDLRSAIGDYQRIIGELFSLSQGRDLTINAYRTQVDVCEGFPTCQRFGGEMVLDDERVRVGMVINTKYNEAYHAAMIAAVGTSQDPVVRKYIEKNYKTGEVKDRTKDKHL